MSCPTDRRAPSMEPCLEDVAAAALAKKLRVAWQVQVDVWTWHGWTFAWKDYDEDVQSRIEAAWNQSARRVEILETDWIVDFGQMKQINERTDTRRGVRRVLISHS